MRIEDELRGALDVPAPPPATLLEDVLARGRRRVAFRRAGISGGVLALVAVVGIGIIAWPSQGPRDVDPVNWAQAIPAPGHVADPPRPDLACKPGVALTPKLATSGDELSAEQMRNWRNLTQSALPEAKVDSKHPEQAVVERTSVFTVDVLDDQGTGTVRFSTKGFGDSPAAAADIALWATGGCTPPRRTTRGDGTVFQLYDVSPDPQVQSLYVFRPDGRAFRLDQVSVMGTGSSRTRETLPLTEAELVKLGAAVAGVS